MGNFRNIIIESADKDASIIDAHVHVGFSINRFLNCKGSFCQSLEELQMKMIINNIDYSIVFPFAEKNDNILRNIRMGNGQLFIEEEYQYQLANFNLINEIINKGYKRFIPFMIINLKYDVQKQLNFYKLYEDYYCGFKIHTTSSEVSPININNEDFLNICVSKNLPIIFHTRACEPQYNYKSVIEFAINNPEINVCVAHAAGFDKSFFEEINKYKKLNFNCQCNTGESQS